MDPDEFMKEESEEIPRTRMVAPSSAPRPPAGKRTKDRQELDRDHKTTLIRAFVDFCYWQTLAPIALSGTVPPTNIAVRYLKSTNGADLFTATHRDQNGAQIAWSPKGETRRHVFHGDVFAADHPVSKMRFDIGNNVEISAQRAWLRAIRSAWLKQHGNKDHDYAEYIPNRNLRIFEDASLNRIALQNFKNVAATILNGDADSDLTMFLFPDMFRLVVQTHEEMDAYDPGDVPLYVPESQEALGGEPGDDDIVFRKHYEDGVTEMRVWVNALKSVSRPTNIPTERQMMEFYSVYLNLLCAQFVVHVLDVEADDRGGSISL